jgi:hypothetical protein
VILSRSFVTPSLTSNIPASAPPSVPTVLYCLPTQRFDEPSPGVRRRRGGVRVYLGRPFFSSGAGELPAVIVGGPDASVVRADHTRYTTSSADPPDVFSGELFDVQLPDGRAVKAYQPVYDAETNAWFFDVDVDPMGMYQPFVRLTVVAYNPDALPEAKASDPVQTDIVQVPTVRTLTLIPVLGELKVVVTGPVNIFGSQPRLYARVESLAPGADELTGWQQQPEIELTSGTLLDGEWTALLPGPPDDDSRYRLMVVEEEQIAPDDPAAGATVGRVVYADTSDLQGLATGR